MQALAPDDETPAAAAPREQLDAAIARFAGGIAHDLNNALLAVQGYLELASGSPELGPSARGHLAKAQEAAEKAAGIVSDLLVVGRRISATVRQLDLAAAVTAILPDMRDAAGSGVRVELDLPEGLPPVRADERLLRRLAVSLCRYLAEAMAGTGTIAVRSAREQGSVELSLGAAELPAPTPLQREQPGQPYLPGPAGARGPRLTVALAAAIAALFGGRLLVREVSDARGLEIAVRLPIAQAPGDPRLVLVAQADAEERAIVARALEGDGFAVHAVPGAQEAIDVLAGDPSRIGLVIAGDEMTCRDGRSLIESIRAIAPRIPAIILRGPARRLPGTGPLPDCGVLARPWHPRELARMARAAMGTGE